jgi:hypothetical protein
MSRLTRLRVTPATAVAFVALFVALGGVGYAAATIGSAQIKNNSVRSKDIRNGTIVSRDIAKKTRAALKGQNGPKGAPGAPGQQGPAGPSVSAFASDSDVQPDETLLPATVLSLSDGTGPITVGFNARLIASGSVSVRGAGVADDPSPNARLSCKLQMTPQGGAAQDISTTRLTDMEAVEDFVSVSVDGAKDVAPGTYNVSISCGESAGDDLRFGRGDLTVVATAR